MLGVLRGSEVATRRRHGPGPPVIEGDGSAKQTALAAATITSGVMSVGSWDSRSARSCSQLTVDVRTTY